MAQADASIESPRAASSRAFAGDSMPVSRDEEMAGRMARSAFGWLVTVFAVAVSALASSVASAHGIAGDDQAFLLRSSGPAIGPYVYLGAKHMVTGYDHLLFLAG